MVLLLGLFGGLGWLCFGGALGGCVVRVVLLLGALGGLWGGWALGVAWWVWGRLVVLGWLCFGRGVLGGWSVVGGFGWVERKQKQTKTQFSFAGTLSKR